VVGLDYKNPWLSPFEEMQRLKTHPHVRKHFAGGRRIAYGARAINEGGYQALPKLTFPGGCLVGDTAGFLNVPKIKGTHAAMKSGMLAAEAIAEALAGARPAEPASYEQAFRASWLCEELRGVRNIRPGFARFGMWGGFVHAAIDTLIFRGKAPWTLSFPHADNEGMQDAATARRIEYPRPDGTLTFDRLSSVFISNTNHEEDQPIHLRLREPARAIAVNWEKYRSPETRYCPAGVYEIVGAEDNQPRLQINAQNCVHCKTCDIKDPTQNIDWTTPEGGGGPSYPAGM
jgi:electron-transferring-flavoprotein dehydrogenase